MSNPVFIPQLIVGDALASPPGTAAIAGSVAYKYAAKTDNYTASASDKTIDCLEGFFTISLPTAVGIQGREYVVKNSGAGIITVAAFGSETIDGNATIVVTNGKAVSITSTGTNWIVIGDV